MPGIVRRGFTETKPKGPALQFPKGKSGQHTKIVNSKIRSLNKKKP